MTVFHVNTEDGEPGHGSGPHYLQVLYKRRKNEVFYLNSPSAFTEQWSILLPSQILSSRCRLTLCLSTSAILDGILQLSDSKSKAVPQELRKTHGSWHA